MNKKNATLFWITGLSGAGKTTIANELVKKLSTLGISPILLDGDELRAAFNRTGAYSREDRLELAYTYSRLAKLLNDQGFYVIVATISMFHEVRAWNRQNIKNYIEVYLKVSEEERVRRNPKGLYGDKKAGALVEFHDRNFEEPESPDLVFDGSIGLSINELVETIIEKGKL